MVQSHQNLNSLTLFLSPRHSKINFCLSVSLSLLHNRSKRPLLKDMLHPFMCLKSLCWLKDLRDLCQRICNLKPIDIYFLSLLLTDVSYFLTRKLKMFLKMNQFPQHRWLCYWQKWLQRLTASHKCNSPAQIIKLWWIYI